MHPRALFVDYDLSVASSRTDAYAIRANDKYRRRILPRYAATFLYRILPALLGVHDTRAAENPATGHTGVRNDGVWR